MNKIFNPNSIRILRQALNLTQEEFAAKLGKSYSKQVISQWENSMQVPSVPSLLAVVNTFSVPFDIFFEQTAIHSNKQLGQDNADAFKGCQP